MRLNKEDILKVKKQFQELRNIFKEQAFLDFIGEKCLKVLREETSNKAPLTVGKKMNDDYSNSHMYQTTISSNKSVITLTNEAKNQNGEYFSAYIEYGTGVFSEESTRPNGWVYPTDEADRNTTKKQNKFTGEWYAFTKGQVAKEVYTDALEKIESKMDEWIDEYISMKGVK